MTRDPDWEPDHKQEWSTEELQKEFDVIGFQAPYVVVKRKFDGRKGSLEFTHSPRMYFNWVADRS